MRGTKPVNSGARGVGKTWMIHHEIENSGYDYVDLSDDKVYRAARANPTAWFTSLGSGVVIDEAQRLSGLSLLVKQAVDRLQATSPLYILTGSSRISRSELGGQDPLVRRALRYRLDPLTQREITHNPHNLIDDLWEGELLSSYRGPTSQDELLFCQHLLRVAFMAEKLPITYRTFSCSHAGPMSPEKIELCNKI